MPAVHFYVRWPDGKEEQCYSPSTVIYQAFKPGDALPLAQFMAKAETSLKEASNRVKSSYGYYCSSASDQFQRLQQKAAEFDQSDPVVTILSMREITQ